jgi:flagellar protein FlaJ
MPAQTPLQTDGPLARTVLTIDPQPGTRLSPETERLLKPRVSERVRRKRLVWRASLGAAGLLGALALLSLVGVLPSPLAFHFGSLALLAGLGPPGFHAHREHQRIRRLEEQFPDFLRDIASSHKGGLTLHQAAAIAARGSYGELTADVRKMADQLAWNLSFSDALQRFAERVDTPLVHRAVNLILQADRSGGSTSDVLLAAARDARELKMMETERRATMGLYTIVVYITFLVFLAVTAILYARFVPQIVSSTQAVQGLEGLAVDALASDSLTLSQYKLFYFTAALVQGLGDGLVAGALGTGKVVLGLRHSFWMVLLAYGSFAFLL